MGLPRPSGPLRGLVDKAVVCRNDLHGVGRVPGLDQGLPVETDLLLQGVERLEERRQQQGVALLSGLPKDSGLIAAAT